LPEWDSDRHTADTPEWRRRPEVPDCRYEISISSVQQDESDDVLVESGVARLVIMTHRTTEGRLRTADHEIAALSSVRGDRIRMPIADGHPPKWAFGTPEADIPEIVTDLPAWLCT